MILETLATGRPLGVRAAYDALDAFGRRYGELPLRVLLHLSVPQSFRADFVNLVKINFVNAGADVNVDADVLLSPLVEAAAAGYYRLDPNVRRQCLMLLDAAYRDQTERRSIQVARFLFAYIENAERQAAQVRDPLLAEYLSVHRWVALAFVDPTQAAEAFARELGKAAEQDEVAARLRLGSIISAVEIPLAGQPVLLAYARFLNALITGDTGEARRIAERLGDDTITIGGIPLRSPRRVLATLGPRIVGLEPSERPGSAGLILINVPPPPEPELFVAREKEMKAALYALLREQPGASGARERSADGSVATASIGPLVLVLLGPKGIGKWTMARHIVHDPVVRARFADGIVWLGEDGMGYAQDAIHAYARAVSGPDLFNERGYVEKQTFRSVFASRRVLFVADQLTASDIIATLIDDLGPNCALILLREYALDRPDSRIDSITLAPLDEQASSALADRWLAGSPGASRADVVEVTGRANGWPLLLRLLCASLRVSTLVTSNRSKPFAQQIPVIVGDCCQTIVKSLASEASDSLFRLHARLGNRTVTANADLGPQWQGPGGLLAGLVQAGILEDLGDRTRMHPLVHEALFEIRRQTEPESEPAPNVHLYYAEADADFGWRLWDDLANRRIQVLNPAPDGQPSGRSAEGLIAAMPNAHAVIVVLTEPILGTKWVSEALEFAREHGTRIVAILPSAPSDEVRSSWLSQVPWLEAWDEVRYEKAFAELSSGLGRDHEPDSADELLNARLIKKEEGHRPEGGKHYASELFRNDLLVSYRLGGFDREDGPNLRTWAEAFVRELEAELRQHPKFGAMRIFVDQAYVLDQQPDTLASLTDQLRHEVANSALLVILMSPQYLNSKLCREELDWWVQAQERLGLPIHGRIFVARILPTEEQQWPSALLDERGEPPIGYIFYDRMRPVLRPYDWSDPTGAKPFRQTLLNMVGRIWTTLATVKEELDERRRREAEVARLAADAGQVIYVHARPAQAAAWEYVCDALVQSGFAVVPAQPDPIERDSTLARGIAERRIEALSQCDALLLLGTDDASALEQDLQVVGMRERQHARARFDRLLPCAVLSTGRLDSTSRPRSMASALGIEWIDATRDRWPAEVKSWLTGRDIVTDRV